MVLWGGFEGSVLDSLEYGFGVEVVGAVGVDMPESGGAYVGEVLVFGGDGVTE